jgi:hypothetical protein
MEKKESVGKGKIKKKVNTKRKKIHIYRILYKQRELEYKIAQSLGIRVPGRIEKKRTNERRTINERKKRTCITKKGC